MYYTYKLGWPEPYIYGAYVAFWTGKSPNTVHMDHIYIYGPGQPYFQALPGHALIVCAHPVFGALTCVPGPSKLVFDVACYCVPNTLTLT